MLCLCGDTNCPSCGPAQGADSVFEMVCEWLDSVVDGIAERQYEDDGSLAEELANRLGSKYEPQWFVDAIEKRAREYARDKRERKKWER